jgi:hypothetical protein
MTPREARREIARLAATYGYEVSESNGGHLRLTKPGYPIVFTSKSTSDWRSTKNLEAKLRRAEPQ